MKFTGVVTNVVDKSGTNRRGEPFKAMLYRIEEQGKQYPESLCGETFGDRVPVMREGDFVEVDFSMSCKEYEGKWYGKNNIWRVNYPNQQQVAQNGFGHSQGAAPIANVPGVAPEQTSGMAREIKDDDLPF